MAYNNMEKNAMYKNMQANYENMDSNTKIMFETLMQGYLQQYRLKQMEDIKLNRPLTQFLICEIPLNCITVAEYQRIPDELKIAKAIKNFDACKVDVKCANYRDEKIYLMDGWHTYEILKAKGYSTMLVKLFFNKTLEEEAKLFASQDEGKTRVSAVDKFNASTIAGEEWAKDIQEICNVRKLTIRHKGRNNAKNNITSVTILKRTYEKYGKEGVELILDLLIDASYDAFKFGFKSDYLCIGTEALACGVKYGDEKYITLLNVMKTLKNPDAFVGKAKTEFPNNSGRHGEGSIQDYVRHILGII